MLAKPANRHIITRIKAAITAGIRPMAMIFHLQPNTPWEDMDFLLLEAYQMLQDEICPKCGHPIWLCRSQSNRVIFEVGETYCGGERAIEEYRDSKKPRNERAKPAERKEWGRSLYTTPKVPPQLKDAELPTREEFYKEMASQHR